MVTNLRSNMKNLFVVGLTLLLVGCSHYQTEDKVAITSTKPLAGASHFKMKQYQVDGQSVEDNMIFFGLDKNTLSTSDKQELDNIAKAVKTKGVQLRIEGHTDERGSAEYNVALGWRRAQAVAAYLQSQGVAKSQMWLVSYGKEKPIVYGHSETAWKLNRRSYISLVTGAS